MTEATFPKPGVNWAQPQWRIYHQADSGVVGAPGGSDRQVFADGSGPYIKRLPGARYVQGIYGADDAIWQGTVAANTSGQPRIDRVVDQLGADGVITTVIVEGTPSTTPAAPDLVQTAGGVWQEHLASFRVKPGFTNIVSSEAVVADERRFMPVRVIPVSSEALRPASPRILDENVYPDGRRERWNGTTWVDQTFANATKFWTARDTSGVALAPSSNGTSGSTYTVTTPAGTALLTVSVNLNAAATAPWQALAGLKIDGVDRLIDASIIAGPGATLHGATTIPLTAGAHTMVPRYVTGPVGSGVLTFVTASFTLLMGVAL